MLVTRSTPYWKEKNHSFGIRITPDYFFHSLLIQAIQPCTILFCNQFFTLTVIFFHLRLCPDERIEKNEYKKQTSLWMHFLLKLINYYMNPISSVFSNITLI